MASRVAYELVQSRDTWAIASDAGRVSGRTQGGQDLAVDTADLDHPPEGGTD